MEVSVGVSVGVSVVVPVGASVGVSVGESVGVSVGSTNRSVGGSVGGVRCRQAAVHRIWVRNEANKALAVDRNALRHLVRRHRDAARASGVAAVRAVCAEHLLRNLLDIGRSRGGVPCDDECVRL